jgi:hypothetical protein
MHIVRSITLAVGVIVAGLVLQCASDPNTITAVLDGGVGREAAADDLGGDAAAPDAAAPRTWFTMSYRDPGGTPDKLEKIGSSAQATMQHHYSGSTLVPVLTTLSFRAYDATRKSRIFFGLNNIYADGPGAYAIASVSLSEYQTESGKQIKGILDGQAETATLKITAFTSTKIAGSYSADVVRHGVTKRTITGAFEVILPKVTQDGELKQ